MPLFKKKIYNLTPSPNDLKAAEELFVIPETKECFRSYDEYIAKVFLYSSQHWSCQFTGRSGLTYNDARSSEEKAMKRLNSFPDCFKETVLRIIHKGEGTVKEVVEKCWKFLTTHYCLQEVVILNTKNGKESLGVVTEVLNSSKENLNLDGNKENGGQCAAGTEVVKWKYSVQLEECDVVLTNILTNEIKRKTTLPSKELLKLFIKSNAERFSVDGKDMWLLKDDVLVQRYDLPSVSKSSIGLKEAKNLLRSPLGTIIKPNGINTPKQKTKKISPPQDPSQRTLSFFVQTPNANATTPSKKKNNEKMRGSPVMAELKIFLTPERKVKEALSGKSKQDSMKKDYTEKPDGNTARHLFTVDQDEPKVVEKADEVSVKTQNAIPDNDEKDFVVKKQNVKTSEAKKKTSTKNAKTSTGKKSAEKKVENDLKKDENIHLNKLTDAQDKLNKKVSNTKHDVITLDDDFSEHEKKIVQKNALKKQKTLSQMFKFSTLKKSSKTQDVQSGNDTSEKSKTKDVQSKKANVVVDSQRDIEMACSNNNELAKKIELPRMIPLPSPIPVVVSEQLGKYYGEVLMITEFVHSYENFLRKDVDLKCSPDDLVSGLMSDGAENVHFLCILISFLNVLLTDLCKQDSSKKFSDLGVDLLDMRVSGATVGELTRLYLQRCHNDLHSTKNEKNLGVLAQRKLSENILVDLNKEDIVNLSAVQKLEVLVYLLERILISEVFYSHYQKLNESKRQAWVKKFELDAEIRDLLQEQKKQEELKQPQKEIDMFLEKNENGDGEKEKYEKKENDSKLKEENSKSSILTKRQEMAEESKIEKEKQDEMRRLSEELYQRRQKIERLKEVIDQTRDCRRTEALGSDRNHSRYWLFQSHPERLYVERTSYPGDVVDDDDNLEEGERNLSLSDNRWYYYTTTEDIVLLMSALRFQDERENALRQKLKMLTNAKKLSFQTRQTTYLPKGCTEKNSTGDFVKLKEELCDLASRINEGSCGNIEDLETWLENVSSRSSHCDLVTLAVELASALNVKSLSKQLGDRELWLKEDWVPAVMHSMTSSRLRFYLAVLDYCIMWDACPLYLKCKICRRKAGTMAVCDKCRQGYHIECLRPALEEVPDEEWLCCICTRGKEGCSTRQGARKRYQEVVDEEETQDEVENDDYCDVCGCEGTQLICCDNCPKVYHKECHDPPLRNIPRGVWKCCSCQGRRPTAKKCDIHAESEEHSDQEFSQDDSSQDVSYSSESSSESGSESESSVDDTAAVERAERAKRREMSREEEAAKTERSRKKKKMRIASDKVKDEKVQNKKYRETIKEVLNEDSSEEEISRAEKRPRLRKCEPTNVKTNERNEENRSNRKRKCNSSEDEHSTVKRKPRQNSELRMCETLLKDLMHHEDSWPFIEPVDLSEVPDYLKIVASPMDFGTIKRKLNAFEYSSYENCISDIKLVFANSDQYNLNSSDHGLAGISLEAYFKEIIPSYFPKYELQKLSQKSSRLRSRKC